MRGLSLMRRVKSGGVENNPLTGNGRQHVEGDSRRFL
jgi:hypothetical protein